jgi:hypothetical protein
VRRESCKRDASEIKVLAMSNVLSSVLAFEEKRQVAGLGPTRRVLHAALLRVAVCTAKLAARLEQVEVPLQDPPTRLVSVRPYAAERWVGVHLVEATVYLAVAVYFMAGLVSILAA